MTDQDKLFQELTAKAFQYMLYMQHKSELQGEQRDEVKAIEQIFNDLTDAQRQQYADTVRTFEAIRDNHDVLRDLLADLEDDD